MKHTMLRVVSAERASSQSETWKCRVFTSPGPPYIQRVPRYMQKYLAVTHNRTPWQDGASIGPEVRLDLG